VICANIKISVMTQTLKQKSYNIKYKINNKAFYISNIDSLSSAIELFLTIAKKKEKRYYYSSVLFETDGTNKKVLIKQNLTIIGANNGL